MAQFEKVLLVERTNGRPGRRPLAPKAVSVTAGESFTLEDLTEACNHMAEGKLKAREVAKMYADSERSLWRNLRWASDLDEVRAGA